MDGAAFDRLTRLVSRFSRRDVARALLFAATAVPLTPVPAAVAQSEGLVALGGACTSSADCRQHEMQGEAVCADNGFASDGELNCCLNQGCCATDADCCGDLRCATGGEFCNVCAQPPFPTRGDGQVCTSDFDCLFNYGCQPAGCVEQRCRCFDESSPNYSPERPDVPDFPDADAAMLVAETLSGLEVRGRFDVLYSLMHPNARAVIPREAVVGWYEHQFAQMGEPAAQAIKVRFISWTWEVTGQTFPETADVATRQRLFDGTVIRDEVRLVKDEHGNWSWFFGRDRAFVEEQIARYGQ
jgi:hypothetical protein